MACPAGAPTAKASPTSKKNITYIVNIRAPFRSTVTATGVTSNEFGQQWF
jgi:hypothetical protein